jgi:hypothetical protein
MSPWRPAHLLAAVPSCAVRGGGKAVGEDLHQLRPEAGKALPDLAGRPRRTTSPGRNDDHQRRLVARDAEGVRYSFGSTT